MISNEKIYVCSLVQDLLPNYTDELTSKESEIFIQKHLQECAHCRAIYENMVEPEKIPESESDDLPIEKFIQKHHRRKIITLASIGIWVVITLIISVFTIIMHLSEGISTTISSDEFAKGYFVKADGTEAQIVDIAFDAKYIKHILPTAENDHFQLERLEAVSESGEEIITLNPYENSLTGSVPVSKEGTINSLLVTNNAYDFSEFTYHGLIYARNTFDEFIIWKPGDDGYLLCYPSTSAAQTIGQLEEFIDEMQLEKGTLSEFLKYLTE